MHSSSYNCENDRRADAVNSHKTVNCSRTWATVTIYPWSLPMNEDSSSGRPNGCDVGGTAEL